MRVDSLCSEEGSEEESEEGSEEVSEESSEDSSEEDQDENQTIVEVNIQGGMLEEVVILLKQSTRLTKGLTVRKSSRVTRKKPAPPLPKPDLEPVLAPRALSPDLNPDSEPEDSVEQVLMTTLREVKITRLDLFYKDKKKLKLTLDKLKALTNIQYFITITMFNTLIDLSIKIKNKQYKMILDKNGGSYFNCKKTNSKKDHKDLMELDAMKKGKTFKRKGKKHFKGRSKKRNSFRISLEELDKRRKNKLCFKCKLFGYMANTYKKDNKSSMLVKVRAIRILRIMDILSETSGEESLSEEENSLEEEEEQQSLVIILELTVKTDADEMAIARILKTDFVLMTRTQHIKHSQDNNQNKG
ncbi:hypothetical protein B7463_g1946, partial [Scytalidium lignicola]